MHDRSHSPIETPKLRICNNRILLMITTCNLPNFHELCLLFSVAPCYTGTFFRVSCQSLPTLPFIRQRNPTHHQTIPTNNQAETKRLNRKRCETQTSNLTIHFNHSLYVAISNGPNSILIFPSSISTSSKSSSSTFVLVTLSTFQVV